MIRRIGIRIRDRFDPVEIGISLAIAALLSAVGFSTDLIVLFLALVVITPAVESVLERVDPAPSLAWFAFGVAWIAAGAAQLRGNEPRIGGAFLAIGCWICLDGLERWQRADSNAESAPARESNAGESADELSRAEVVELSRHNRRLVDALREADRPLTVAELRSRTGLSEADLERVLSHHDGSGPIDRVANGYVLDESETGVAAMGRTAAGAVAGRLLRPFRLFRLAG